MQSIKNTNFLKASAIEFINATNEVLSVFEQFPSSFTLKDNFSTLLAHIYQGFMLEHFPSARLLVDNQKIFSFCILCRSVLDIVIQLKWLLSLDEEKKEKAINCFLEFEGIYLSENGRHRYEWQCLIDKNYTLRDVAIAVGIDEELFNFPVNKMYRQSVGESLVTEIGGTELKLTVFDYLSKISHWNPRLLNELVGMDQNRHLGYTNEYLKMCIIALPTFISCLVMFAEIFCGHLFEDQENKLEKLQKIRFDFQKSFADLIDSSLVELAVAE